MRGQILGVDVRTGEGQVTGDDGRRYRFKPEDWAHRGEPAVGLTVDFEPEDMRATSIFPLPVVVPGAPEVLAVPGAEGRRPLPRTDRNRIVAALLAFFLGVFGIHRFYLGRKASAITMLLLTITFFGMAITGIWALVDCIRYLVMSDREFAQRYGVEG